MNGQLHLVNLKRFVSRLVFLVLVPTLFISIVNIGALAELELKSETIVVMPGDTLWNIAERQEFEGDIRSYILQIREFNQMKTASIQAGQVLVLPPD